MPKGRSAAVNVAILPLDEPLSLQEAYLPVPACKRRGGGGGGGEASTFAVALTVWLLLKAYTENAATELVIDIHQLDHGMCDSIHWNSAHVPMLSWS